MNRFMKTETQTVRRYTPWKRGEPGDAAYCLIPEDDGEYVLYSDYDDLLFLQKATQRALDNAESKLAALEAERDALKLKAMPSAEARIADAKCRNELRAERDELKRMVAVEQDNAAKLREQAREALDSDLIIASCNCHTKSPDTQFHKVGCKYRLIVERDSARIAQQALEAERQSLQADYESAIDKAINCDMAARNCDMALRAETATRKALEAENNRLIESFRSNVGACLKIDALEAEVQKLRGLLVKAADQLGEEYPAAYWNQKMAEQIRAALNSNAGEKGAR